jgi:hypothetical protein
MGPVAMQLLAAFELYTYLYNLSIVVTSPHDRGFIEMLKSDMIECRDSQRI